MGRLVHWLISPGSRTTFLETKGGNHCSVYRIATRYLDRGVNKLWKLRVAVTGWCLSRAQSCRSISCGGMVFLGSWSLHPLTPLVAVLENGIYTQGWIKDLGCDYNDAEPIGLESRAVKIWDLLLASSSHTLLFHFVRWPITGFQRSGSPAGFVQLVAVKLLRERLKSPLFYSFLQVWHWGRLWDACLGVLLWDFDVQLPSLLKGEMSEFMIFVVYSFPLWINQCLILQAWALKSLSSETESASPWWVPGVDTDTVWAEAVLKGYLFTHVCMTLGVLLK